jgi:hypothetical protein
MEVVWRIYLRKIPLRVVGVKRRSGVLKILSL